MFSKFKRRFHKFKYYLKSILYYVIPSKKKQDNLKNIIRIEEDELTKSIVFDRVNYYNKLEVQTNINSLQNINNFKSFKKTMGNTYFYDFAPLLKYFSINYYFHFLPGDITYIPSEPAFVKSRPISDKNQNSVLLKLNQVRHYYYEKDNLEFKNKKPILVWRGAAHQIHRQEFIKKYYSHPKCDVGVSKFKNSYMLEYKKDYLTIEEQLKYKYIMSIEGNDVATNLKWIFRSNSICFMRKPRYETWFMEGRLEANIHYVELKDDYSDLEEKIEYCENNPEFCLNIIKKAKEYSANFDNPQLELQISLLVMQKYFEKTRQVHS
ncbi:lipopolysaccharide A protein [Aliarcobacter thereius]|uniref:Lipopolysaccharide A protein n=1 Tax=Aliarcobacter thereius TaxID=544718 RepID=A0A5R9HDS7_9BACT|nr:glycosyl transferase family 90 [Aliarcobacter thereius]TLS72925.1 lipopolysaccharide A protein [Aliarcobacter thereius]